MELRTPYVLFLGDVVDPLAAKTARGILDWRSQFCLAQYRLPGCRLDFGLPDLPLEQAAAAGAKTLVVGLANSGGRLEARYVEPLRTALSCGLDVAAGLHQRLGELPSLAEAAERFGRQLCDVRFTDRRFATGNGQKRTGLRLLTVGTDCSCGKKYTALALERDLRACGVNANFRATGQTGILIAGCGVAIDAVVADFISGAAEWLSPANDPAHWDLIEGQGSLFHPAFAGVSLGLLHGSQPDAFVVCHEPTRITMRGVRAPLPSIGAVIEATVRHGRLTNPGIRCVGIALNTAAFDAADADALIRETAAAHPGMPVADPMRQGTKAFIPLLREIGGVPA